MAVNQSMGTCDRCGVEIDLEEDAFGFVCDECDYDLCLNCSPEDAETCPRCGSKQEII